MPSRAQNEGQRVAQTSPPQNLTTFPTEAQPFIENLQHNEKPVNKTRNLYYSLSCWWPETLAFLLSLAGIVCLVVVLKRYDHTPQAQWDRGWLTINGLVAIIATVTRTALMYVISTALCQGKWLWFANPTQKRPLSDMDVFEQASRSAWGSIVLLWKQRRLHLASLGAVLTILSLAFDAFSQQVISIDYWIVLLQNDGSVVPHATSFMPPYGQLVGYELDAPTIAAIYAGLMSSNATMLNVTCRTGNCTFPITPSLSVCGECTNITSSLTGSLADTDGVYNISLPDGVGLSGDDEDLYDFVVASTGDRNTSLYHYQEREYDANGTRGDWIFAHFETINMLNDIPGHFEANECALWFCVKAYNVSIINDIQQERVIGNWSKPFPTPPNDPSPTYNITFASIPTSFNTASGVYFSVPFGAFTKVRDMFQTTLPGWVENEEMGPNTYYYNTTILGMFNNRDNLSPWISNYADVMTNAIRSNWGDSLDGHYAGATHMTEAYINVRWKWLVFPTGMVVGSLGFSTMIVWRTKRSTIGPWKGSALAPVFISSKENIRLMAEGAMGRDGEDLVNVIGSQKVYLNVVDQNWKLS